LPLSGASSLAARHGFEPFSEALEVVCDSLECAVGILRDVAGRAQNSSNAPCPTCGGAGYGREVDPMRSDESVTCPDCAGTGLRSHSISAACEAGVFDRAQTGERQIQDGPGPGSSPCSSPQGACLGESGGREWVCFRCGGVNRGQTGCVHCGDPADPRSDGGPDE